MAVKWLGSEDAEQLRAFEREGTMRWRQGYNDFFAPVTLLASRPCSTLPAAPGMRLLDVATGPGNLAAAASDVGPSPSASISRPA